MSLDLHDIAHRLGGEVSGDQVNFPGPDHSQDDRSATLWLTDKGFTVHSRSTRTTWQEVKDYVLKTLGGDVIAAPVKKSEEDLQKRVEKALTIWSYGRDPRGTPVEKYLTGRGLTLPEESISWVPYCQFGRGQVPAMVCLVRHIHDDVPLGIHRTAVSHEGKKQHHEVFGKMACRAALGPIADGAVKFGRPTDTLGIGEGIESTLSLRVFRDIPVWSLLNDNGLAAFPVIDGIKTLVVAVDNDEAGRTAFKEVARRWVKAGREVIKAMHPEEGKDLNDLVMGGRHDG